MSVCVVDNNTMMTTSASSTELNDTNSLSTKAGIPAVPQRPTIIRVDKQNVQENTDESKPREVPKVPPRPPPPRPGPPPVPTKQPAVLKSSDSKKKKPEITIVSARPMSEVCFRDKKPEIPVPPRPQKPKDQGEVSSVPSINCTNVALPTEPSARNSTTDVHIKLPTLPPERPCLPPAAVIKRDPPKVPPQRPAPPKSTLSAPIKSTPPPRPPACIQTENSKPPSDLTDSSPNLPKELSTQSNSTSGSVTPPKPRPRTFIDTSSKPLKTQRSLSAYKPTKNEIPPRPLPRKFTTSSTVDSDVSKTSTVEPFADVIPPPKPSRHQSFRNSTSPILPSTRPCSSLSSLSQETSSASDPSIQSLSSAKISTDDEETLEAILLSTEGSALDDKTDSSESVETPESFKIENESSSTDKTTPCPLPPKKNSVVISQPSFKCSSEENLPVPSPRIKRSPRPDIPAKPDTPASTPVNSDPVPIVCEEPKDFILPSAEDILTIPKTTVSKPTIIRVSTSTESLQEPNPTSILASDFPEKQPNLSISSEKLPSAETTKNVHPKDSEDKRSHRPPPPIPKKSPISANVCDRNNSTKTVSRPSIPKKPPKPAPPLVAQMPVKSKENLLKESESSSASSKSIKNLFSKKSSSPSSSSTDLKKPSAAKSRKAAEMLQTTKDYTRRISKSLGFTAAEEPRSTVWYTDKTEESDEKPITEEKRSSIKKKENPSIWYVDTVPEEETDAETAPVPAQSASLTDNSENPEKDNDEKVKEMDNSMCQPTEEPSPTEISAFQKYHSYMKRTIEQAVGIQLSKSSSSLIDEDINEKTEHESDSIKPQPVKPAVPDPPKQRPPIPPKESRPPKPSVPPQVKPNVPAVPPKRPPVPASVTQPSTKPEGPVMRPPPPRPKPVVSVKPTVPNNQNIITNDSDLNSKNVIKSEKRSSSIENLIGKFEEELCKKSVPPPRPALPANKPKSVTINLTDNEDQQLSSEIKETPQSADVKTEITSTPSNINDGSNVHPDENENLSVSATEVGENTGGTENSQTSNLTGNSSIDENANEEAKNEPGKPQDLNTVVELKTEEASVTETEQSHKVGYSDSFNQRCQSLMNDLKVRFESVEKDDTESKIEEMVEPENVEKADNKTEPENVEKDDTDSKTEEVVEPVNQPLDRPDVNPEKMQESNSNEETGEKELEEKVEPSSSEEKSSSHLSLGPDMTEEVSEKTSLDDSTSQLESKAENKTESSEISQEVTNTQVIELDSKDAGPETLPKSSSTSKLTGPRAIASFDFDAQAEDELTLKKDDTVQLLSWVDASWLYGNCHGKTGIFPLAFVHVIEPLPQTPSDTSGNQEITDVSQESAMEDDANRVSNVDSKENSTLVMDDVYQNLSEAKAGSGPESMKETEATVISTKEVSEVVANTKDDAEEDELTDSDQLDKINIPVGGEETVAYAIYDFEGEDGELSFKEGDAITILKWINDDWLLGKKEELVGNLPANFVNFTGDSTDELELVDTDGPPEPKEPPPTLQLDVKTDQLLTYVAAQLEHVKRLKGFACARFDFEARDDDELSFKDGDRIEIVEFVNNDWIRGSLHKKEGIFPAAFVSVEEYSPDEENPPSETTKVRALHNFTASANDELSFKAGALITCYGDVLDLPGWSNGSFEGKTGIFPSEFVTQEGI